eukprot:CAMPEP_0194364342 /NCGR_PEP_ID=MMETSP0174-20130528/12268_1 /TAXON_ID=216777 /ORGANISM="Proboscia alata, Strain PI-D3" /LENGTH=906 /DNA_ID=CAMNT_0039138331 /DNA_START=149 /DNA_END=2869 /DNA_ORIENTATION=+
MDILKISPDLDKDPSDDDFVACVQNLFKTPASGIEKAFEIVAKVLKEHALEQQNMKKEFNACIERHTKEKEELVECYRSAHKEHMECQKNLKESQTEFMRLHKNSSLQIGDLNNEIKVMACNLQGFDEDPNEHHLMNSGNEGGGIPEMEASHLEENTVQGQQNKNPDINNTRLDSPIDDDTIQNVIQTEREEHSNAGEGECSNNEESSLESEKVTEDNFDSKSMSDGESQKLSRLNALVKSSVTGIGAMARASRRATISVSKQKLEANQTLAVRLERLESCQLLLEKALNGANKKVSVENNMVVDFADTKSFANIINRLIFLEEFLGGFGASIESDLENIEEVDEEKECFKEEFGSSGEGLEKDMGKENKLSPGADERNESNLGLERSHSAQSGNINSISEKKELINELSSVSTKKEDSSAVINKLSNDAIDKPCNVENNETSNVTISNKPSNVTTSGPSNVTASKPSNGTIKRTLILPKVGNQRNKSVQLSWILNEQMASVNKKIEIIEEQINSIGDRLRDRVTRKSMELHMTNVNLIAELSSSSEENNGGDNKGLAIISELTSIKEKLSQVENMATGMVPKCAMNNMFGKLNGRGETDQIISIEEGLSDGFESVNQFKEYLEEELDALRGHKVDANDLSDVLEMAEERIKKDVDTQLSNQSVSTEEVIQQLQGEVTSCKTYMDMLENKLHLMESSSLTPTQESAPQNEIDFDAKIKLAAEEIRASLNETMTSKLEAIDALEKEIEKVGAQLVDKPDESQVTAMLRQLEEALSQRLGNDHTIQMFFENMRLELSQKLTKPEVLNVVKNMLNDAKKGIQNNKETLMVGRMPYKCLACDSFFPHGVNRKIAVKKNHKALPSSGYLTPSTTSSKTRVAKNDALISQNFFRGRPGALRPLHPSRRIYRR